MERLLRVAINTWWEDDPAQRYRMQITDRDHLAGVLQARSSCI